MLACGWSTQHRRTARSCPSLVHEQQQGNCNTSPSSIHFGLCRSHGVLCTVRGQVARPAARPCREQTCEVRSVLPCWTRALMPGSLSHGCHANAVSGDSRKVWQWSAGQRSRHTKAVLATSAEHPGLLPVAASSDGLFCQHSQHSDRTTASTRCTGTKIGWAVQLPACEEQRCVLLCRGTPHICQC